MKEFHPGQTNAVVAAGMGTAIAVVLSMLGLYIPIFSTVIFLMLPLPIIYIALTQDSKWAVIVAAGTLILDSVFFGVFSGAFICAIFGCLGVVLGICYRRRVPPAWTLIAGAVGVAAAFGAQTLFGIYVMGLDMSLFSSDFFETMKASTNEALVEFYSGETLAEVQKNVDLMYEEMKRSLLFAIAAACVFYSWAAMAISKYIFTRLGLKGIPSLPPVERWEFPVQVVYFYLLVIGISWVYKDEGIAQTLLYNLIYMCTFIFWLQGLAILWWSPHRWQWIRPFRWLIAIGSVFLPIIQQFMILSGLFDLLFHYRKKRNYQ